MQLGNRWAIGWIVWRRLDLTAGIGSRYARRGNVVTGNGTALRRCSPDGRTNVRVLLFQLCGLPVLPLRLFHHGRLRLAPASPSRSFFIIPRHVRLGVTVHVYRSGFFLLSARDLGPPVQVPTCLNN